MSFLRKKAVFLIMTALVLLGTPGLPLSNALLRADVDEMIVEVASEGEVDGPIVEATEESEEVEATVETEVTKKVIVPDEPIETTEETSDESEESEVEEVETEESESEEVEIPEAEDEADPVEGPEEVTDSTESEETDSPEESEDTENTEITQESETESESEESDEPTEEGDEEPEPEKELEVASEGEGEDEDETPQDETDSSDEVDPEAESEDEEVGDGEIPAEEETSTSDESEEEVEMFEEEFAKDSSEKDPLIEGELLKNSETSLDKRDQIKIKLAELEIRNKKPDDILRLEEVLNILTKLSTSEQDLEQLLISSALKNKTSEIAKQILEDKKAKELISFATELNLIESEVSEVKKALSRKSTRVKLAVVLEDDPEIEDILERILDDDFKSAIIAELVNRSLDRIEEEEEVDELKANLEEIAIDLMKDNYNKFVLQDLITKKIISRPSALTTLIDELSSEAIEEESEDEKVEFSVVAKNASSTIFIPTENLRFKADGLTMDIDSLRSFSPGVYNIEIRFTNPITGQVTQLNHSLDWGVLLINTNQDTYKQGTQGEIDVIVLDDLGRPVCDAEIDLEIKSPSGSLGHPTIENPGSCNKFDAENILPDYRAVYNFSQVGEYQITATATLPNGQVRHMSSKVKSLRQPAFQIERKAATKLFPRGKAPMNINIFFDKDFSGLISDVVPEDFSITDISDGGIYNITEGVQIGLVSWQVDAVAGDSVSLSYKYDAPDQAPEILSIGPLTSNQELAEERSWKIVTSDQSTRRFEGFIEPEEKIVEVDPEVEKRINEQLGVNDEPSNFHTNIRQEADKIIFESSTANFLHDDANNEGLIELWFQDENLPEENALDSDLASLLFDIVEEEESDVSFSNSFQDGIVFSAEGHDIRLTPTFINEDAQAYLENGVLSYELENLSLHYRFDSETQELKEVITVVEPITHEALEKLNAPSYSKANENGTIDYIFNWKVSSFNAEIDLEKTKEGGVLVSDSEGKIITSIPIPYYIGSSGVENYDNIHWEIHSDNNLTLVLENPDPSSFPIVIDPTLEKGATTESASFDFQSEAALQKNGNVLVQTLGKKNALNKAMLASFKDAGEGSKKLFKQGDQDILNARWYNASFNNASNKIFSEIELTVDDERENFTVELLGSDKYSQTVYVHEKGDTKVYFNNDSIITYQLVDDNQKIQLKEWIYARQPNQGNGSTKFTWKFSATDPSKSITLSEGRRGTVDVNSESDGLSFKLVTLESPWYIDGNGERKQAKYKVAGDILSLEIKESAGSYPLLIDPTYTLHQYGRIDSFFTNNCLLRPNGQVNGWGENFFGESGEGTDGSSEKNTTPVSVKGVGGTGLLQSIDTIAAGANHCLAVKNDDTLYAWGNDSSNQLSNGSVGSLSNVPVQVESSSSVSIADIELVAGGGEFTLILKTDGTLWAVGDNAKGQLGNNDVGTDQSYPVRVCATSSTPGTCLTYLTDVISIDAGSEFAIALKSDGTVWTWGSNFEGQLGDDNSGTDTDLPVQVVGVGGTGNLTSIDAISAGENHALAVNTSGSVFAWGSGEFGKLGNDASTNSDTPVQVVGVGGSGNLSGVDYVSGGSSLSLALKTDGTVFAWGYNQSGQLGHNTVITSEDTPVQVVGVGGSGNLSNIVAIAAGGNHALALDANGTVYAWGENSNGELGDGNNPTDSNDPVEVSTVDLGPAGLTTNLELWFKADLGTSTTTDGSTVSTWFDRSGQDNDGAATNTPAYQSDSANLINGHPVVEFLSTDYMTMSNTSLASETSTAFVVASPTANTGYRTLWKGAAEDNMLLMNTGTDNVGYWDTSNGSFKDSGLDWAEDEVALFRVKLDATTTVGNYYKNAGAVGSTAATIDLAGADYDYLGNNNGASESFGNIAEAMIYNSNSISATDIKEIESYLALKYGITLDQSTAQDYLASDGTTEMWNKDATGASTYDFDIAGIGQDADSTLEQTASRSENSDGILQISSPSDLEDLEFMTWGNDDASTVTLSTETPGGIPSGADGRLTREWLVQNSLGDGVGTVTVAFDLTNQTALRKSGAAGDYALLIDTDGNFTNATVHTTGASISNNEISFTGATIADGSYISLAGPEPTGPGSVTDGLLLWLKADSGVTTSGVDVTDWTGQSINARVASQGTTARQPHFTAGDLNYNPTILFDGSDDYLTITGGVFGTATYSDADVYIIEEHVSGTDDAVLREDLSPAFFNIYLPWSGTIYWDAGDFTGNYRLSVAWGGSNNVPYIWSLNYSTTSTADGNKQDISRNGLNIANDATASTFTGQDNNMTIGSYNGSFLNNAYFGEIIIFGSGITATENQKIESYLAIKYGITVDQSTGSGGTTYLDSAGNTIWAVDTSDTFENDITGIGKDDDSDLDQLQSKSENTDSILRVADADSQGDLDFLLWSNDDGAATWTSTGAPAAYQLLTRKWQAQETNDMGTVDLEFDIADADLDIPGAAGGIYYFISDTDNDGSLSDETPVAMKDDGTTGDDTTTDDKWTAQLNFPGADSKVDFTIATALPTVDTISLPAANEDEDLALSYTVSPASTKGIVDWQLGGSSMAVLNMPFEDNGSESTTATDYSTNANDGTVNGPTFAGSAGVDSQGTYDFDESDDYISIADDNIFSFGNGSTDSPFSISAWIEVDAYGTGSDVDPILAKYNTNTSNGEWSLYLEDGNLTAILLDQSSSGFLRRKDSTTLSSTSWQHVAMTYDGSATEAGIKLYINGVQVDDLSNGSGSYTAMENLSNPVEVGRSIGGSTSLFDGSIDEVYIFDRELTSGQITEYYNAGTFDADVIDSTETSVADSWEACVTPNSGFDGAESCSGSITVTSSDAPGGVFSNLKLWLDANDLDADGLTNDNPADGTSLDATTNSWNDHTENANHLDKSDNTFPVYESTATNLINFNPGVDFESTSNHAIETTTTAIIGDNNPYTKLAVVRRENADVVGQNIIASGDTSGDHSMWFDSTALKGYQGGTTYLNGGTASANTLYIVDQRYGDNVDPNNININGLEVDSEAATNRTFTDSGTLSLGNYRNGTTDDLDGLVAEVLVYDAYVSDANMQKIYSYFGIKYGITVDQSTGSGGTAYQDSAGTSIWAVDTSDTFENDIAGIGQDYDSGLDQLQSKSENSDSILRVADATAQETLDFLMWSNNDGAATWTTSGAPATYKLLTRQWQAQETNDIGTVDLEFDIADADFNVPALDAGTDYYFIYDSDNDGDLSDETPTAMKDDGSTGDDTTTDDKWTAQLNFVNTGDGKIDFTIATEAASAPGGVSSNLNIWVDANDLDADGLTNDNPADGTSLDASTNSWNDLSGNSNDLDATNNTFPVYESTAVNLINYNPAIDFESGTGHAIETTNTAIIGDDNPYTKIAVILREGATGSQNIIASGDGSGDHSLFFNGTALEGYQNASTYLTGGTASASTLYIVDQRYGDNVDPSNININGLEVDTEAATLRNFTDSGTTAIGNYNNNTSYIDGLIPEILIYDTYVSDANMQKIYSYFGIKYGVTVDQSTGSGGTAYQNSAGTSIWAVDTFDIFENDIAGIGQDDGSVLDQLQSKSQNSDGILRVADATAQETLDFLIWSNDNGAATWTTTGAPTNYKLLTRQWQAQETNDIGTVDLEFDIADADFDVPALDAGTDYYFIYDSDNDGDLSDETPVAMKDDGTTGDDTTTDDKWTAQLNFVNTGDGKIDFTIATELQIAPGGVTSNIALWLKANSGTSTTTDDATVSTWSDQSGASNDATATNTPAYQSDTDNLINGYPVVEFLSTDYMTMANSSLSSETTTSFVVASPTANSGYRTLWKGATEDNIFIMTTGTDNVGYWDSSNGNFKDSGLDWAEDEIALFRSKLDATSTVGNYYKNGGSINSTAATIDLAGADYDYFGGKNGASEPFGNIAEAIIYDSNSLSATDISKIESYLALKYGITLDQSTAQDYLASDGTTEMWNKDATGASTYDNDIAGIGQDDDASLSQTQSRSINSDSILDVSGASGLANLEFFSWGNDNASTSIASTDIPGASMPANATHRITREWLVDHTGGVGTVTVAFDLAKQTALGNSATAGDYALLIDADGTFSAGATIWTTGASFSGNEISFTTATIADGSYIALAGPEAKGPGGVTTDLELWFTADTGVTNTGNATDATVWTDQSTGAIVLDHSTSPAIGGTYPTYYSSRINYNPALDFDTTTDRLGVDSLSRIPTDEMFISSVYKRDAYAGPDPEYFFSYDTSTLTNSILISPSHDGTVFTSVANNTLQSSNVGTDDGIPHILSLQRTGTTVSSHFDHTQVASETEGTSLVTGGCLVLGEDQDSVCGGFGSGQAFEGDLAELVVYSDDLTSTNRQKVNSYLALKYGITVDQSTVSGGTTYLDSAGNTIWAVDTSDTFENDIAGIGQDDDSILDQLQSKSENSNGILRVADATAQEDLDFLMWSNNDGAATWTTSGAPASYKLLTKQWQAQEINDIGTVDLEFDIADADFDVPALDTGTDYYFVYDSNNDGDLSDETPVAMKDDGTTGDDTTTDDKWTAQLNFVNTGDGKIDFTIATESSASVPTVTDGNISINTGSGTSSAFIVGDQIIATWDNSASGDNNSGLTTITADLSGWGGSATATMTDTTACSGTNADDIYEACFTVVSGAIDATNVNTSVTATSAGGPTTTADTSNATVDNEPPVITANGTLTITVDNGTASVAAVNNGTDNQDKVTQSVVTLSAADGDTTTIDLTALTGEATLAAATQSGVVIPGALDNASQTFTITVTDNAGNTDTAASDAISVDNTLPTGQTITPGSTRIIDNSFPSFTVDDGTDANGINTSTRALERQEATYASNACGAYGSFSSVTITGTYPNVSDETATGSKCYIYKWTVDDNNGNSASSSETAAIVRVPFTTIAITGGNSQSYGDSTNNPIAYTLPTALQVQVTDGGTNFALTDEVTVDFAITSVPSTPTATGQSLSVANDNTDASGNAETSLTFGDRAGAYQVQATSTHTSITVEPTFTGTAGNHFALVVTESTLTINLNAVSNASDTASPTITATTNAASYNINLTPNVWPISAALDEILNWAASLGFGWNLNSGTITAYSESTGDPAATTVYTCTGDSCQGANVVDINIDAAIDASYTAGAYSNTLTISGESISY